MQRRLRAQADKSKAAIEAEKNEIAAELTAMINAKAEADKKRKQIETNSIELTARFAELEAAKSTISQDLSKVKFLNSYRLFIFL